MTLTILVVNLTKKNYNGLDGVDQKSLYSKMLHQATQGHVPLNRVRKITS